MKLRFSGIGFCSAAVAMLMPALAQTVSDWFAELPDLHAGFALPTVFPTEEVPPGGPELVEEILDRIDMLAIDVDSAYTSAEYHRKAVLQWEDICKKRPNKCDEGRLHQHRKLEALFRKRLTWTVEQLLVIADAADEAAIPDLGDWP